MRVSLLFVLLTVFLLPTVAAADTHFVDTSIEAIEEQSFASPDALAEFLGEESFEDLNFHNGGLFSEFTESPQTLPGTVSCFDYYTFGSVQAVLTSSIETVVPGVPVEFSATIQNYNSYPVVGGSLVVKIFRENKDSAVQVAQGNHTVDQFTPLADIDLGAKEQRSYAFTWVPPDELPGGRYYAATYFVTAGRFNLLGLSFTDDIAGNTFPFTVTADNVPIYFDKNSVRLNGAPYRFIGQPVGVPNGPVSISAEVVNESNEDKEFNVVWFLFRWDTLRTENIVEKQVQRITVPAGGRAPATYTATDEDFSVYLAVPVLYTLSNAVHGSFLNIRFLREQVDVPRINFPSLFKYPLVAGEEATVFSCVHNAGLANLVEDTELSLTLLDDRGRTIHKYTYRGSITGAMMGLADSFVPRRNYDNVTLVASLTAGGVLLEEVEVEYRCATLNPGEHCDDEPGATNGSVFLGGVVAILIVLGALLVLVRRKNSNTL